MVIIEMGLVHMMVFYLNKNGFKNVQVAGLEDY